MASKDDPLETVYYFRLIDWIERKPLLNRLLFGSILLFAACTIPLSLYQIRENRDELFTSLIAQIAFSPVHFLVMIHLSTAAKFVELRRAADERFRPLRSEGQETYERIARSNRRVSMWLWGFFAYNLIVSAVTNSFGRLRDLNSVYHLLERYQVGEGLTAVIAVVEWMHSVTVVSLQARWTHYIWVQMVLLEENIKATLGVEISRDDDAAQELCSRHLREFVRFHCDVKSIANNYFYNIMKMSIALLYLAVSCSLTATILFFFVNLSVDTKIAMTIGGINMALATYIGVMNAQAIIDQSEVLSKVLYGCPWYEWNKSNCTTMIIIMSTLKKPLMKTEVFGMFELNYEMFLKIFRVTYGLATAVLNMK